GGKGAKAQCHDGKCRSCAAECKMPRIMDLSREREIRALRAEGFGVREIARQIKTSPSTVSRILRGTVDHLTLAEMTARVQHIEQTQTLIGQKLHALW